MSEKQFQAEKLYYISLSIAKSMLERGVIDREVFAIIDTARFRLHYYPESP